MSTATASQVPATGPGAHPVAEGTRRARRLVVGVAVLLVVLAVLLVGIASGPRRPTLRLASFSLPRLEPTGLDAADPVTYPLRGSLAGRPVVLVFFASWCVACHADLPEVARLAAAEQRAGDRAVFVGIDGDDTPSAGWAFARQAGVGFPVAADRQEAVARQLGLVGLPDLVAVAPSGRVVATVAGVSSLRRLEQAVASAAPRHALRPGTPLPAVRAS
ncbi:TlpA family protein disulfide reductase [Aciditerrimonas ferrireducens]|uniref:TlpA family protein disulfide reductase n=1 Tax=Aciditerrimonas ferrireducens TaxID=667306 RepID=UPI0020067F30|nr:TlpA disulfide reductase family protein [Aciditerrimonas ferrireducens]MCK4177557.1 TlpA family protein disulfide reductase [Aciditerrimonas ferrireducens]